MLNEVEQLAKEYLDRTETYDRSISSGKIVNDAIRLEGEGVRKLSMDFARQVRKEICRKAAPWYSWTEIHCAIQHSHRWYKFEPWANTPRLTTGEVKNNE